MKTIGIGPSNFEPWSNEEDNIQADTPLSQLPHHGNGRTLSLGNFNLSSTTPELALTLQTTQPPKGEDFETLKTFTSASTRQEKFRALYTEESFNGLFDFSIASKAPSGEILLQSRKQMTVTWCGIKTVWWMMNASPTKNCNMVLRCRCRVCGLALSSNNKTPYLRSPGHFFRIVSFNFNRVSQCRVALMVPNAT
ncbi:hypothetical protein TNCV_4468901 [Trichonephila clavipes]|nr:hypothetical protein TNCV_4468901 [Trichonephila clavipes]